MWRKEGREKSIKEAMIKMVRTYSEKGRRTSR